MGWSRWAVVAEVPAQRFYREGGIKLESLVGPIPRALMIAFLVSVMISIGLEVTAGEVLTALRNKRLLTLALLGNFIVVPLLGLGIARLLPMPANIETGFLLLAAAPGALFTINFTRKMRDSVPLAAALLFLLTVLSVIVTPLLADVLLSTDEQVTLRYDRAVRVLLLYVLLPLIVGFALKRWAVRLARALRTAASACADISYVLVTVLTVAVKSAATKQVGINGLLAMLLLIVASMVVGWILGGPGDDTRRVLTVNTGMRNVALCLVIAIPSFPGAGVDVAVVAFSALMLPPNLLFTIYQIRKMKRVASSSATQLKARG